MLEDISEEILEKNARKNVRTDCQKRCKRICQKRMAENMSEKDVRRYVERSVNRNIQKICQKECQTKCQKECFYWTVSIDFQAPMRLETPGRLETPRHLETPGRPGIWNYFELSLTKANLNQYRQSSITRISLSQFGQINRNGHRWAPNQEKDAERIILMKFTALQFLDFIKIIFSLSSSPDFSTISDKYIIIWNDGGNYPKYKILILIYHFIFYFI